MTARHYVTEDITVHWDSAVCIHSAVCVRTLPTVFRPSESPWVHVAEAGADEIAATVDHCPSGALTYTRTDIVEDALPPVDVEPDAGTVEVRVHADGPYEVRGTVVVRGDDGEVIREITRVAYLCRCGGSARKPFCDNTHERNGFRDPGKQQG